MDTSDLEQCRFCEIPGSFRTCQPPVAKKSVRGRGSRLPRGRCISPEELRKVIPMITDVEEMALLADQGVLKSQQATAKKIKCLMADNANMFREITTNLAVMEGLYLNWIDTMAKFMNAWSLRKRHLSEYIEITCEPDTFAPSVQCLQASPERFHQAVLKTEGELWCEIERFVKNTYPEISALIRQHTALGVQFENMRCAARLCSDTVSGVVNENLTSLAARVSCALETVDEFRNEHIKKSEDSAFPQGLYGYSRPNPGRRCEQ